MIGFDFEYYKPDNIKEATELFHELSSLGKKPIYYGGGSEFISMARMNNVYTEAVIDIKGIVECNKYKIEDDYLIIGAGVTLSRIAQENLFPLLSMAVKRIADHTMQGKITMGGNVCGTIIYKEAILALLVSNAEVIIADTEGQKRKLLKDVFSQTLQLNPGELVLQFIVHKDFLSLPHLHVKRTKNETIDYPLISMVSLKDKDNINISFSGLSSYPFRSYKLEKILNADILPKERKIQEAISIIENKIEEDLCGSKAYKKFMLYHIIDTVLDNFKEGN